VGLVRQNPPAPAGGLSRLRAQPREGLRQGEPDELSGATAVVTDLPVNFDRLCGALDAKFALPRDERAHQAEEEFPGGTRQKCWPLGRA
jgi:hypothetical protein